MRAIPRDWLPGTPGQVAAFASVGDILNATGLKGLDTLGLVGSSKGDWTAFQGRCERASSGRDGRIGAIALNGTGFLADPLLDISAHLLAPIAAARGLAEPGGRGSTGDLSRAAATLVYGRKSLPGCIEVAVRWHALQGAIRRDTPDEADVAGGGWAAVIPDVTVGGVLVTALTSSLQLDEEGGDGPDRHGAMGLSHCVSSYRGRARQGTTHILSLRRVTEGGRYERLATAEVAQEVDGMLSLVQLRAFGNGDPDERCVAAMRHVTEMEVPYVRPSPPEVDDVREECGYDWRDPTLVARAFEAYAFLLPRALRKGPDALGDWLASHLADVGVPRWPRPAMPSPLGAVAPGG